MTLTVGSLFSGIGGVDLAAERVGMNVLWQSENDKHASTVLEHHWPGLNRGDIHDISLLGDQAGPNIKQRVGVRERSGVHAGRSDDDGGSDNGGTNDHRTVPTDAGRTAWCHILMRPCK